MKYTPTNDKKFIYFYFSKTCCWIRFQVENIKMIVKSRVKLKSGILLRDYI